MKIVDVYETRVLPVINETPILHTKKWISYITAWYYAHFNEL